MRFPARFRRKTGPTLAHEEERKAAGLVLYLSAWPRIGIPPGAQGAVVRPAGSRFAVTTRQMTPARRRRRAGNAQLSMVASLSRFSRWISFGRVG